MDEPSSNVEGAARSVVSWRIPVLWFHSTTSSILLANPGNSIETNRNLTTNKHREYAIKKKRKRGTRENRQTDRSLRTLRQLDTRKLARVA